MWKAGWCMLNTARYEVTLSPKSGFSLLEGLSGVFSSLIFFSWWKSLEYPLLSSRCSGFLLWLCEYLVCCTDVMLCDVCTGNTAQIVLPCHVKVKFLRREVPLQQI